MADLPATLLVWFVTNHVCTLSYAHAAKLATSCKALRDAVHAALAGVTELSVHQLGLQVASPATGRALFWARCRFASLKTLRLNQGIMDMALVPFCSTHSSGSSSASNSYLVVQGEMVLIYNGERMNALPAASAQMANLDMVDCRGSALTDFGVSMLTRYDFLVNLRVIDATMCTGITHRSVTSLAPRGIEVYRLPEWYCKKWVCLQHPYVPLHETHTYERNGTFSFTREQTGSGYVESFVPVPSADKPTHYNVKYRFVDADHYRPCVAVKQCASDYPHIPDAVHSGNQRQRTAQLVDDFACPAHVPDDDDAADANVACGTWVAAS